MTRPHLRLAGIADRTGVEAFYRNHPHANYAYRPAETVEAIADDRLMVVEVEGRIAGAGALFPLGEAVELGQARITAPAAGTYPALLAARALLALRRKPALVFCEIDEINTHALAHVASLGFEPFDPPPALLEASLALLPPDKRPEALGYGFIWHRLPLGQAPHLRATLARMMEEGQLSLADNLPPLLAGN